MTYAKKFTNAQRQIAYKQGQKAHGRQVAKQQAQVRKNRSAEGVDTSKGKVHFEGDRSSLNKTQLASMDAMEVLAKALGIQLYVESFEGTKNANKNGWYDPKDGSIHIKLNAGADGKGTMLFTVAHELTHFIRQWSPAKFEVLANFLVKQYGEQGVPISDLIDAQIADAKADNRNLTREEALEEVVADSMETMLADGSIIEMMAELRQQDLSLWQKICEWFKDLAGKIQAVVDAYKGVQPDSTEGRMVADMKDIIGTLEALYMDALVDASENFDAGVQKITTEDSGGVKYQARKNGSMDDAEIQAVQGIGEKSIFAFDANDIAATSMLAKRYWTEMGTRSPFFRAWFGDWRAKDTTPIRIATKKGVTKNQPQFNDDTNWVINISGKIFDENKVHNTVSNREARPYMPYLDEIVQNAVLLDTWGADPKSPNTLLMHSLYAVADIGNGPEVLKLYVEEMNDPAGSKTGKRAYNLQNIEKAFATRKRVQGKSPSSSANVPNAIRTVADLHAAVKVYDSNFTPKPASRIVNEDGTPMVVYHGTSDRFTQFKDTEISPREGSFFFAQNREDAEAYSGNGTIMEVYVNLQNPIDYNDMPSEIYRLKDKKAQVDALKKLGYDGWYCDMDTGWGEVSAFYPEQIKSATDNIGTFDGSNPDIRYSQRDVGRQEAVTQALEKENAKLREDVGELKELVKLQRQVTNGTKFTKTSVEAAARYLKQNAGAKGGTQDLSKLLNGLYEYIASTKELTWEGVKEQAQAAADWLWEHIDRRGKRSDYAWENNCHGGSLAAYR